MHAAPKTKEALCDEIRIAFAGVSRGDGISLHQAEEMDCRSGPEEERAARSLDTDRRWQDVPDEWIEGFSSVWYFFDPTGFRYYLPALMIWDLGPGSRSMSASSDNAECLLYEEARQRSLMPLLSLQQLRAVADWLYFHAFHRGYKPEEALAAFQRTPWREHYGGKGDDIVIHAGP